MNQNVKERPMKKNEALPSKYLNAADIGNGAYKLTVANVVMEKMENDGTMKPVMHFVGAQKSLPLNATNWDNMASVYEDESDNWIGKQVEVYTEATRMPNGSPTRGVRIRPVAGADTAAAFQAQVQSPLTQPVPGNGGGGPGEQAAAGATRSSLPGGGDIEDDIPFAPLRELP